MSFLKRLFGGKRRHSERDLVLEGAATVIGYQEEGWIEILRDKTGKVSGFWLGQYPGKELLPEFLKMLVTKESLGEDVFAFIARGDYRFLKDTGEQRGGHYVMVGEAKAPGE